MMLQVIGVADGRRALQFWGMPSCHDSYHPLTIAGFLREIHQTTEDVGHQWECSVEAMMYHVDAQLQRDQMNPLDACYLLTREALLFVQIGDLCSQDRCDVCKITIKSLPSKNNVPLLL